MIKWILSILILFTVVGCSTKNRQEWSINGGWNVSVSTTAQKTSDEESTADFKPLVNSIIELRPVPEKATVGPEPVGPGE